MKFKSEVLTQASGSIGGTTYSHNRGGLYRRARSIPTNPNSTQQQTIRSNFGSLANAWSEILTQPQREAWTSYALSSPIVDRLGDSLVLTGQQMYIRCNSVRINVGVARVDDGPVGSGLAALTFAGIGPTPGSSIFQAFGEFTDAWANEDGGGAVFQISRQRTQSINFFKGPYRIADYIPGNSTSPPETTPMENPFNTDYVSGKKLFYRVTAFQEDGRISNVIMDSAVIA